MVSPKIKKSEETQAAAILQNPLLLFQTASDLGRQQSVYDYFGVAVTWGKPLVVSPDRWPNPQPPLPSKVAKRGKEPW